MMITVSEGKSVPDISETYYAGNYGIALWSRDGDSGFVVLQSVAGVWATLGAEAGVCDVMQLCSQFAVPQKEAESLCQQLAGIPASQRFPLSNGQLGDLSFNEI
ncbi:hypothetical protein NDI52_23550 [Leptolyngbya sp. PL-A3]|nr:hypothetical protein [Leptolyngbya sp. FACHB-8]